MELPAQAATGSSATASTTSTAQDDARLRELYNALRSGDDGVAFEPFAASFYFLQHHQFSLFDVKDAFESSTGSNERFLGYRDFQYALTKVARARTPCLTPDNPHTQLLPSDAVLLTGFLDALALLAIQKSESDNCHRMDSIRRQLTKTSVLAVLQQHLRVLIQSFQLYGEANSVSIVADTSTVMTLDGFVDFLNAYFEYEAYFSYQAIETMARDVAAAFLTLQTTTESTSAIVMLDFPQFIELFSRVASKFHVQTLEREGAQLRKAVESCRLEFSIELLLEKMAIRPFQRENSGGDAGGMPTIKSSTIPTSSSRRSLAQESTRSLFAPEVNVLPGYEGDLLMTALTLEIATPEAQVDTQAELPTMTSLLAELRKLLDAMPINTRDLRPTSAAARQQNQQNQQQNQHNQQKRPQSVLFARLPPRKTPPEAVARPPLHDWQSLRRDCQDAIPPQENDEREPPLMTLIREVVAPPPLPANILKRLEYALTYQNTGQFHMALGALHKCRCLYQEYCDNPTSVDATEVRVFFSTSIASVYDSARNDLRALAMYLGALKAAQRLPFQHGGRALVLSCLGCALYYLQELPLAKKCHEHVLAFRRTSSEIGETHVDTATAMNNLACCLSQELQNDKGAIDEAYLFLKTAKRVFCERFGPSHPRVQTVARNFERVLASQRMVVADPQGALARGEYAHVIPGSRFQIRALVPVKKEKTTGGKTKKKQKNSKTGGKKKK